MLIETAVHPLLATHYAFGLLVVIAAVAGIFSRPVRRLVIYALLIQISIGAGVLFTHHSVPAGHWVLSLLVGGVYAAASIIEKRGGSARLVTTLAALGALVIAVIFYFGQEAAKHAQVVLTV